jgi:hypothetical protein
MNFKQRIAFGTPIDHIVNRHSAFTAIKAAKVNIVGASLGRCGVSRHSKILFSSGSSVLIRKKQPQDHKTTISLSANAKQRIWLSDAFCEDSLQVVNPVKSSFDSLNSENARGSLTLLRESDLRLRADCVACVQCEAHFHLA